MSPFINRLRSFHARETYKSVRNSRRVRNLVSFIQRKPLTSLLLTFAIFLGIMFLSNTLGSLGKKGAKKEVPVKSVSLFHVDETPKLTLQAKVEKEGVVTITAQMPGIVQEVSIREGDSVQKGENLIQLASSYSGANAAALQRQLSQTQYQNVLDTFQTQKDLVAKQREIANKTDDNTKEVQRIARESRDDTRSLLDLNETIITSLNRNLETLQNSNVDGANDSLILQTQQLLAQAQGGTTQLRGSLKQLELQAAQDKPPAQLAILQKDITLKQLDLQEKALDLNKEVSRIQVQLAVVSESLMHPVSPFAGTVERVFVHVGDSINPGTQLVVISGKSQSVTAIVTVPRDTAYSVNTFEPSSISLDETSYAITPSYISKNATDGDLYTILYSLPSGFSDRVTDGEYLPISVPIGANTTSTIPFVLLDSVYQSQDEAYVYVVDKNKAKTQKIKLGTVYGGFVEVISGLKKGDKIITNRNIVSGDVVKISN